MDAVGSFAAVAQIAGQLINLGQQILLAREAARRTPKAIEDLDSQLRRLFNTAKQVVDEPALQIKPIHEELEEIYDIAMELQATVEKMRRLQTKSRHLQILRALVLGQRDDSILRDVVGRLRDAQDALGHRISVVQVGTTTGVGKVVDRIEMGVDGIRRDLKSAEQPRFDISDNTVDAARQENSIDVWEGLGFSKAWIRGNQALNNSQQTNTICIALAA